MTKINKLQKDITNNIQQRAIEKTGSKEIPLERFTTDNESPLSDNKILINSNALEQIKKEGFELCVKGKTFSYGNTKLPNSTMIINLASAKNCPSREQCPLHKIRVNGKSTVCYADVPFFREPELRDLRNQYSFEYLTIKETLQLLSTYIENAPCRIKRIRLSEAGDFTSQEQVDLVNKLAAHIYAKYGITTTCYTRAKLDFTRCDSLIVNSSFPSERIAREQGADRQFLCVRKNNEEFFNSLKSGGIHELVKDDGSKEQYFKCSCNCKICNFCYQTKSENGEPDDGMVKVYCLEH